VEGKIKGRTIGMGKLTVQDLAKSLAGKSGLVQRDASLFASEVFAVILQGLEKDGQVKVKGLGTFKIISVEARESISVRTGERVVIEGHEKVSFTPDSVMKELVNKPFSQFETVVLNEGVEFEDLNDDAAEEEPVKADEEIDEVAAVEEQPVEASVLEFSQSESAPQIETDQKPETDVEPKTISKSVAEPELESESEPEPEPEPEPEVEPILQSFVDEEEESVRWWKWPLIILVVLALMGLSAFGGYRYAMYKVASEQEKTAAKEPVAEKLVTIDSVVVQNDSVLAEPVEAVPVEEPKVEQKSESMVEPKPEPKPEVDPYAAKDERVRLGAYRIVGTEKEIKIAEGQTFYSICRAHLGPDMECYVEVFNDLPRNPKLKTGQIIKIPKLESKKKRRR
jgi:nucleoid DNA-binding protein